MILKDVFVTGTDTGVGKTLVSCALLKKLTQQHKTVLGMKPVASGCRSTVDGLRNADAEQLIQHSSFSLPYLQINPYAFADPIAPHIAADKADIYIDSEVIVQQFRQLSAQCDHVVVEGVGGWKVPINRTETMEDVAIKLGLPVLLVVGLRLGCINHALLSYQAILDAGLVCVGWVANQIEIDMPEFAENIDSIQQRLDVPMLACIPHIEEAGRADISPYIIDF